MEEITVGETTTPDSGVPMAHCAQCQLRAEEDASNEESSFAFLLAMVPVMVLTLFGQIGLL